VTPAIEGLQVLFAECCCAIAEHELKAICGASLRRRVTGLEADPSTRAIFVGRASCSTRRFAMLRRLALTIGWDEVEGGARGCACCLATQRPPSCVHSRSAIGGC
jgi:hypothetical protein